MRNVFEAILECGHDEDFVPTTTKEFAPTQAPAGSAEKLAIMASVLRWVCPCGTRRIVRTIRA